jgi:tRNA pseudouridine32 synthase/23S rRNA pseudouridine746 synthase
MTIINPTLINEKFDKHLTITCDEINAIDLLAKNTSFSRQKIKQIMHKGAVWLTQGKQTRRLRRANKTLKRNQILHLYYNEKVLAQTEFQAQLIADEHDYSVWFKPKGMLSQGTKYGDHSTIYRWAETHIKPQRNAFLVHRLDRATSGLILIAHSKHAATALSQLFSDHHINKYYKALVKGSPKVPQTINIRLDGKPAITQLLALKTSTNNNRYSLLDIQILTGKKHQIRQHLAQLNYPILGDRLYGNFNENDYKYWPQVPDLCLTSYKINFISPFDQQLKHYELGEGYYPALPNNIPLNISLKT